jgi:inorganic triphosphatase YgiF
MPIETELKLRITPTNLARLRRHALLRAHRIAPPLMRRLHNIYYDTPDLDLHQSGMALRLRRAGRQWLQTLKGGGSAQAGLHRRSEWEMPVRRAALDFSQAGTEWDEYLPHTLRGKLQPLFVTDFSRTTWLLDWQGAQIELCMDRGEVRAGEYSAPICELELELKSGEARQLFALALALLDIVPLEPEAISKAERGYRLLSGRAEGPVKAIPLHLEKTATLAQALQALIWSCLAHWQDNLRGAMESEDAEYLHQLRVALRRLRVALRMTMSVGADEHLSDLNKEVGAICVGLGHARDWDVFIAQTLQPMCARMPAHEGLQVLLQAARRQRDRQRATLRGETQARATQRLMLRLAAWMNGSYWQGFDGEAPARGFASRRLRKLARRIAAFSGKPDAAGAAQLHALRILAKKLRYSAEFFASLYGKHKVAAYVAALAKMQDTLGQINDIAVAHRLLDELDALPELSAQREAGALARGWIAHELSRRLVELDKALRAFRKQPAFWE